jgi:hypothetical protein
MRQHSTRGISRWLAVALLLAYGALFFHQTGHPLQADDASCALCLAADQLGHAPPAAAAHLPAVQGDTTAESPQPLLREGTHTSPYYARGPPRFLLA